VSVDIRVPEQSLVSVTPEKLLLSNVLVLVLGGPFLIGELSQVLSVLGVMHFNVHNWNSGQCNGREGNQVSQSLPGVGNSFGMVSFFRLFLDEFFTSLFVHMGKSGLGNVLGHMTVARGVEAGKGALAGSSKHRDGLLKDEVYGVRTANDDWRTAHRLASYKCYGAPADNTGLFHMLVCS
jgi:hypothetical protein